MVDHIAREMLGAFLRGASIPRSPEHDTLKRALSDLEEERKSQREEQAAFEAEEREKTKQAAETSGSAKSR